MKATTARYPRGNLNAVHSTAQNEKDFVELMAQKHAASMLTAVHFE